MGYEINNITNQIPQSSCNNENIIQKLSLDECIKSKFDARFKYAKLTKYIYTMLTKNVLSSCFNASWSLKAILSERVPLGIWKVGPQVTQNFCDAKSTVQ